VGTGSGSPFDPGHPGQPELAGRSDALPHSHALRAPVRWYRCNRHKM